MADPKDTTPATPAAADKPAPSATVPQYRYKGPAILPGQKLIILGRKIKPLGMTDAQIHELAATEPGIVYQLWEGISDK